ncbi:MAG: glycosyltransferase [Bacteroidaceae bacterium]|nr:glycosyltransferase [Bacteroidaceae bacterium]
MTISILIPTFNDPCFSLVRTLREQLSVLSVEWEIIVADDCSTSQSVREENSQIDTLDGCRVEWREQNTGRAAIRNYLAQEAKGDWLLFIDSDMVIRRKDFVEKYLTDLPPAPSFQDGEKIVLQDGETQKTMLIPPRPERKGLGEGLLGEGLVLYGGYEVNPSHCGGVGGGLRFVYEKENEHKHTVEQRRQQPYRDFHTSNFMISRDVMLRIPFNENFKMYGYEDVLLGKQLKDAGIPIHHIDNPVSFEIFESNEDFIRKTEESIRTQLDFRELLADYSTLIQFGDKISRLHLSWLLHLAYKAMGKTLRKRLCSGSPSTLLLNIYKLLLFNEG